VALPAPHGPVAEDATATSIADSPNKAAATPTPVPPDSAPPSDSSPAAPALRASNSDSSLTRAPSGADLAKKEAKHKRPVYFHEALQKKAEQLKREEQEKIEKAIAEHRR